VGDSTHSQMRKRTRRTAAEWPVIMARHQASALTCKAFCPAEGIGRSAFWRWRRRLADEDAQAGSGGPVYVELSGADAELEFGRGYWDHWRPSRSGR